MTRPLHDHGTGEQAIRWALQERLDFGDLEVFLRGWQEGNLDREEWSDFYAWLDTGSVED